MAGEPPVGEHGHFQHETETVRLESEAHTHINEIVHDVRSRQKFQSFIASLLAIMLFCCAIIVAIQAYSLRSRDASRSKVIASLQEFARANDCNNHREEQFQLLITSYLDSPPGPARTLNFRAGVANLAVCPEITIKP